MTTNTQTGLPEPSIGRNPPRYRKLTPPEMAKLVTAVLVAFLVVATVYYYFAV